MHSVSLDRSDCKLESDSKVRYITSREDMKRGIAREGGRPGLVATHQKIMLFFVFFAAPPPLCNEKSSPWSPRSGKFYV